MVEMFFPQAKAFFVPGNRKELSLSLSCKRNNQPDRRVVDSSSSVQTSSESLQDGPTSSNFQRCNSTEMDKFLEKFKMPKKESGRRSSTRGRKKIISKSIKNDKGKLEKSVEGVSSDFKEPYPQASKFSSENDSAREEIENVEKLSSTKYVNNSSCVRDEGDETVQEETTIEDPTKSESSESSILLCPICWKPFDCKDAQTTHMKSCASKHNVSMKQLLELLELIQRQEEERRALGIPLLPSKIPKKVKKDSVVTSLKPKSKLDGNIQLGIALSVSLQEAEQQKERDHLLEAGLFEEVKEKGLLPEQEMGDENPLPTAPIFLNPGKKGSIPGVGVPRGRKKGSKFEGRIPALLKRTPEDREKLITEKVAIILVGDEQLNTLLSADDKENSLVWDTKSRILNKYMNEEQILWKMASLSPSSSSKCQFYVDSLSNFISPCKIAAGSKLKHLSQIPGRKVSPGGKAPSINLPDFEKLMADILPSSSSKDTKLHRSNENEKKEPKRSLFAESPITPKQNSLSRDWIMLVGNPEMSDVKVYTEGERKIYAHKLVFFARCPLILKDLVEEEVRGKKSNMLLWIEICYEAAFLFLKYIYGGIFSKSETKINKVLEDLNTLSERYEVRDLLELLKRDSYSEEKHSDSLQDVVGKIKDHKTCREIALEEDEPRRAKNHEELSFMNRDTCDLVSSAKISPQRMEEMHSPISDKEYNPNREVEVNESCSRSETGHISNNDDFRKNSSSPSPIISNCGRSSPDIFQMTEEADSPEIVEVIEEEDPPITQKSSQDSRDSIEYLVSLMEKDSSLQQSSECDPESGVVVKENSQEHLCIDSHVSESPLVLKNRCIGDWDDTIPPETPVLSRDVKHLVISSTPTVQQENIFEEHNNTTSKDETASTIDTKRKLQSFDKSDMSPSPKKIRIDGEEDGKSLDVSKKEVVDLTLSGSGSEAVDENVPLNDSNCSTLPPPAFEAEELSPSNDAVPSPPASPCCGYISNVWDDFDYIPDVPKIELNDSISASQKSEEKPNKENEEVCSKKMLGEEEKIVTNYVPELGSPQVCNSPDSIILLDETILGRDVSSPITSKEDSPKEKEIHQFPSHSGAIIDEKEGDITEKLLDVSLSQINDSVFWRSENEPKEGAEGSFSGVPKVGAEESFSEAPCRTPVRPDLKAIGSNKETPETPVYVKKANVTPLADYSAMKTPLLHKELDRYGIKHLKRNQAKQLLRHIYNELHPVVSDENTSGNSVSGSREKNQLPMEKGKCTAEKNLAEKKKITFESLDPSSEDENSSSDESSGSNSDFVVLEESMHESQFESPIKSQALTQKGPYVDIPTAMRKLIDSDADFHKKILLYEPIWLTEIKDALKAHGAKFNVKQLMDYLDEQCITFRIEQGNRQRRRKTKKTFSLSQPSNPRRKNKEPISYSQPS